MLLREFDQSEDFIAGLENVLQLYIKHYDKEGSAGEINYEALNDLLQHSGVYGSVNKNIINQAMDKSDAIRNMVKSPEDDKIVLNTEIEKPDSEQPQPDLEKTDQGISKTTQQAAASAAEKGLTDN